MEQVLWIGNYEDKDILEDMVKKGYKSSSSQVSQENLILGLEKVSGLTFDIISGSVLPAYPEYEELMLKKRRWQHKIGAKDISVGYCNLKFYNRISCQMAMVKAANEWANQHRNGDDIIVFAYSMRTPVMAAACEVKKVLPHAKVYLIITDLPEYMDLAPSKIKRTLKKIDKIRQDKLLFGMDGYILYAKKMAEYLHILEKKWMLMEGSISIEECRREIQYFDIKNEKKVVMYSGKVALSYGIPELIEGFMKIKQADYELWITGSGDAQEFISKMSQKDRRIRYFGFIESRTELLQLQQKASMLVTTRMPTEKASQYCFPSKIFEYMLTGKPVLTFRIEGIPEEYYEYLVLMNSPESNDVSSAIMSIGEMGLDERNALGKRSREFIIHNKNNIVQSEKIWKFVHDNRGISNV